MELLRSPIGMAVAAAAVVVLLLLLRLAGRGKGGGGGGTKVSRTIDDLIRKGRAGEAARLAAEDGNLGLAFDLYLRAQEPENAAAIAVRRGDLRQAAELYERATNWERAAHFYERSGMEAKAVELRRTRLRVAPGPGVPTAAALTSESRARVLEAEYREALARSAQGEAARAEVQRLARSAADALLADGEIGRAADIYAEAGFDAPTIPCSAATSPSSSCRRTSRPSLGSRSCSSARRGRWPASTTPTS